MGLAKIQGRGRKRKCNLKFIRSEDGEKRAKENIQTHLS